MVYPVLSNEYKQQIQKLIQDYLDNKSLFVYDGTFRRESYAYPSKVSSLNNAGINGCIYKNKYILNCGLFAQMIWMGRSIKDFQMSTPSVIINKDFDWGYYFDFKSARVAYGVMKNSTTNYKANTYTTDGGQKQFITFDNAASMAQELYRKGYEIPYSEADIGDLVFYRADNISDEDKDELEQTSFRYITHVGIVLEKDVDGLIIAESSSVYSAALGSCGYGEEFSKFARVRAASVENRVVMCARHPAAFGHQGNVPSKFSLYRGVDA